MWVISAEVGKFAEGFRVTPGPWPAPAPASPGSLQFPPAALPGCCQAPSDRLLAAPLLAGAAAGLALYVQTPDQPHGGHYVSKYGKLVDAEEEGGSVGFVFRKGIL